MKKSLTVWQIAGFIFTSLAGVLLHFLFNWTNQSAVVGSFSAINESIWEHTKLLFFPMFVFALVENRYIGKDYISFWCVKLFGIVSGVILIPVLYYTINGIFGVMPDWVNIAIFFIVTFFSYLLETKLLKNNLLNCTSSFMALLILFLIALAYAVLTFFPPNIPLFEDPMNPK